MRRPSSGGHSRGFTIVELMLVVGLMGVLLTISLPFYGDWTNRVKTSASTHQIVGLEAEIEKYRSEHPALPDTLAEMNVTALVDPWGRPYQYYNIEAHGKGGARKDHALNPLNTDYDLYSVGPDGVTKPQITQKDSVDDVIRATNGGYVGLASGF